MAQKSSSHEKIGAPDRARKKARGPGRPGGGASVGATTASGIPVFCAYTVIMPAADLKPHPKNPKNHPPAQLDRFEVVVAGNGKRPGNGWRRAIVRSRRSGCITKGHGAWQMAKRRGWDVPVEDQDYASERDELRDIVADNRLAELGATDDAKLAAALGEIGTDELVFAGFDATELERLLQEAVVPDAEFPITAKLGESYDYALIYTENATDFAFLQSLLGIKQERSYKKTGVGLGRAISLKRALEALRENRHSLDVQGGNHDDAPAGPQRRRRSAAKPAG